MRRVRVPGDKSLTQRALILASLAEGRSRLRGLLYGGDADSTAGALRALGVGIPPIPADGGDVLVEGVGLDGLVSPARVLDLANSGTGTRLLIGVVAGSGVRATFTGDDSLRVRPMERVVEPLRAMGARFEYVERQGRLPLLVEGRRPLEPLAWSSPVASAQVKSAILLAGLVGGAYALVTEPRRSRDHTERLLRAVGAPVLEHAVGEGWRIELREPPERLRPLDFEVPGDFSSAAFLLARAALGQPGEGIAVERVGLNPTRTAFLAVLERMGARVRVEPDRDASDAEPIGTVVVEPGPLRATTIEADEVPALIDELPLVAVLGARAEGTTRIRGAVELRTKESDRIAAMVGNLRTLGVRAEELEDGLEVEGGEAPLAGLVRTEGDHRIAMSFGVLAASGPHRIEIDDPGAAAVSFPGFWEALSGGTPGAPVP